MVHEPDISRIPSALAGLNWLPMADSIDDTFADGAELLVAEPAMDGTDAKWRYVFEVLTANVDDGYFYFTTGGHERDGGEHWGWLEGCVDFYGVIRSGE